MKSLFRLIAAILISLALTGCHKPETPPNPSREISTSETKTQLLFEKESVATGVTASFYGKQLDRSLKPSQVIEYITFKETKTGRTIKYASGSDTQQAADFYFADIWSPDGNHILLPVGKTEGFAVYNAKTAIADIERQTPADTLAVWRGQARRYWHTFDGWVGPAAFQFKGELEGNSFMFKYDIPTQTLTCMRQGCAVENGAENKVGKLKLQEAP